MEEQVERILKEIKDTEKEQGKLAEYKIDRIIIAGIKRMKMEVLNCEK